MNLIPFRLIALLLMVSISGCASVVRLPAVPQDETTTARVLDIPLARFWLDPYDTAFLTIIDQSLTTYLNHPDLSETPPYEDAFLVISSGRDGGAFGAGFMKGWSDAGTRPEFTMVTGISTGALIAPFVFAGSEYDDAMEAAFSHSSPGDIYRERGLLKSLFGDALYDTDPLKQKIAESIDQPLLQRIADEYAKGRLLFIGTTNLDARIPVVWNMGAIAASSHPDAPELFHRIVLASASIPGLFPPVLISVKTDSGVYNEMHVDGGTTGQLFAYPSWISTRLFDEEYRDYFKQTTSAEQIEIFNQIKTSAYVIRNDQLGNKWKAVEPDTASIAYNAIETLTHTLGDRDVDRIYYQARRDNIDFNLAAIGTDFQADHQRDYDQAYMQALFEYGYRQAANGYHWMKTPPGILID